MFKHCDSHIFRSVIFVGVDNTVPIHCPRPAINFIDVSDCCDGLGTDSEEVGTNFGAVVLLTDFGAVVLLTDFGAVILLTDFGVLVRLFFTIITTPSTSIITTTRDSTSTSSITSKRRI